MPCPSVVVDHGDLEREASILIQPARLPFPVRLAFGATVTPEPGPVLGCGACNARKSDLLDGEIYLGRWAQFVSDHDADLLASDPARVGIMQNCPLRFARRPDPSAHPEPA